MTSSTSSSRSRNPSSGLRSTPDRFSGARSTPDRFANSPSFSNSSYSAPPLVSRKPDSGRNPLTVAARSIAGAFIAFFTPPEKAESKNLKVSNEFGAPSGRRPIEPKRELKERITPRWAMKKFTDGDAISALDPRLEPTAAEPDEYEEVLWSIHKDYIEQLALDFHSLSSTSQRSASVKEQ
ncbi:hypothetical protein HRI_003510600 [Hibiscus trionum]|uniref:Uncharacterized protein n=1 Tax=Hibiscus trionum TaxID=183268 RepID=A0A9W7IND7_HIBTR|nr:hypothetical protein HRI_003510600 [Hibiscus trionum]